MQPSKLLASKIPLPQLAVLLTINDQPSQLSKPLIPARQTQLPHLRFSPPFYYLEVDWPEVERDVLVQSVRLDLRILKRCTNFAAQCGRYRVFGLRGSRYELIKGDSERLVVLNPFCVLVRKESWQMPPVRSTALGKALDTQQDLGE